MAPKDIRSFFATKSKGGADGAGKRPQPQSDCEPAAKKPKAESAPPTIAKSPKPVPKTPTTTKRKALAPVASIDVTSDDSDFEPVVTKATKATPKATRASRAAAKDAEVSGSCPQPDGKAEISKARTPKHDRAAATSASKAAASPAAAMSAGGQEAVDAVKAVVAELPGREELMEQGRISLMAEGQGGGWGGGGGADKPPENHGKVDLPAGHPDCLTGYAFVISGVLDSMYRHEATDYIKRHGGRVTGAVTGKTSFLLCGKETGNSKFRDAKQKGTQFLDEECLLRMVRASIPFRKAEVAAPPRMAANGGSPAAKPAGRAPGGASAAAPKAARKAPPPDPSAQLWVDKWKPRTSADLVGNPSSVKLVQTWLTEWERVHIRGGAPSAAASGPGAKKDMSKKALLLAGPPGIGKTSSAHIVARECGFEVLEVNASDTRNKSDSQAKMKEGIAGKLSNRVKVLVTNTAMGASGHRAVAGRHVLVMDEVDGMSGGDRGGVTDLIESIKISKMPIICICNDKYKQSLKTLRNHCLELDWRKPTKVQAGARLRMIAQAEGLSVNSATLDALVESSQGDMRVMLGQLQMHRLRADSLSFDDVKNAAHKDADKSPFECARKLLSLESAHMSMMDRLECVFMDMDLVPLLVQENYVNHRPAMAPNETVALSVMAKAADAFSAGDVVNTRVRSGQEWSLMPVAAVLGTVFPAAYMRGHRDTFYPGEMNFPRFTAWLGQNSSANKQKRVVGDLNTKLLAAGVVCDRVDVRMQYLPTLRLALTQPLVRDPAEGADTVISLMQSYLVNREDFDSVLDITKFKTAAGWGADPMKAVESKAKAAFTRSFNKAGLPIKCTVMVEDGKKSKRGAKKPANDEDGAVEGELAEAAAVNAKDEEDEEDGINAEALVKSLKGVNFVASAPKGSKQAAKKSASGRGNSSRGGGRAGGAARGSRGRGRGKSA